MSQSNDITPLGPAVPLVACPQCGKYYCAADDPDCPYCSHPDVDKTPRTVHLDRSPTTISQTTRQPDVLGPDQQVLLQVLPSGVCLSLDLRTSVVLGRHHTHDKLLAGALVDLTRFNAVQRGVSRQHCLIQRQGTSLVVTDLGSTNGTYLNNDRLLPSQKAVVTHGDKLILGKLHLTVFFSKAEGH